MKDANILAFLPDRAPPGGIVEITAENLHRGVDSCVAVMDGGVLVGTEGAGPYRVPHTEVLDNFRYTKYNMTLPSEIDRGEYTLEFYVTAIFFDAGEPDERYRYTGGLTLFVTGGEGPTDVQIFSVSPKEVPASDLASRQLMVRGRNLTQVKNWSLSGRGGVVFCRIAGTATDDMVSLRTKSGVAPKAGFYMLRGDLGEGGQVMSKMRIKIT